MSLPLFLKLKHKSFGLQVCFQKEADIKFSCDAASIFKEKEATRQGRFMVTLGDCALYLRIVFFASPEVAQENKISTKSTTCAQKVLPVVEKVEACSWNFFWFCINICHFRVPTAFENCL